MSGLSVAVGAPREGQGRARNMEDEGAPRGLLSSMRTIELQLVAFIVVFSASGLVPLVDLVFPVFVTTYLYLLSVLVFPSHRKEGSRMEVFHGSRMFKLYLFVGTVVGLFLPLAYVLGGFARGNQEAVRSCTPHLFLLSAQVLSENIVRNLSVWSPPVRAFLVAIYTARRIFSLADWVTSAFYHTSLPEEPAFHDFAWAWFGRALAASNFIYFNINMFCFILPRFIPRAFERYFQAKAETTAANSTASNVQPSTTHSKEVSEKKAK